MFILLLLIAILNQVYGLSNPAKSVAIVTGANGFVGRSVVYSLLQRHTQDAHPTEPATCIISLVRSNRVEFEQCYWNAHLQDMHRDHIIKVMEYDMLDGGASLSEAVQFAQQLAPDRICLYHVASTFGPTADPVQTAHDNVKSAVDAFQVLTRIQPNDKVAPKLRMVLTSSMAAVRATNQPPINGKYYTHKDWNTLSKLDEKNWGSCYQWSKMESERQVLELAKDRKDGAIEFVALCPSFIFGPPPPYPSSLDRGSESRGSSSYSIELVKKWLSGESEVQSRLCIDVRDVALAHVQAGTIDLSQLATDSKNCHRYILSTEERLSSEKVGDALKNAIRKTRGSSQPFDLYDKIRCDTVFDGGAIKIGDKEVDATNRLKDLGVVCRSVHETMEDMATCLLDGAL